MSKCQKCRCIRAALFILTAVAAAVALIFLAGCAPQPYPYYGVNHFVGPNNMVSPSQNMLAAGQTLIRMDQGGYGAPVIVLQGQ